MLVLSRKVGQVIMIGDNIEVTVVEIKGNNIKLGIKAPIEIPVARTELPPRNQSGSSVKDSPTPTS